MQKQYRIGEVAAKLHLKTSVLRFWETEFAQLEPMRTAKGQRVYTEATLQAALRIQQLLHVDGMTIEGARRVLEAEKQGKGGKKASAPVVCAPVPAPAAAQPNPQLLHDLRTGLLEIKALLASQENV
jgi:DNA-binding transcriptional MerR regulator